ncbi:c-type cytochrome [Hyphococcus flavus]|uniref:C-type cytochrome n=1 Tax=Hyphococcus flavus TaxID=1866326 RepID=A0AAE9ZE11_9PROT|nr:c-type cytochrome [Hyphococcus flavus]WDI32836.1 c-type cytochrome [Hyphococcus flavus]
MKDPLFFNKVAFSVLAALLLIFGLPQLTAAIFGGGHHGGGDELHLAYGGEVNLDTGGPVEEAPEVDLGTLLANADASAGERRSAICKSCHTFEQGGANGTGPNLWNIVGGQVAQTAGFNYTSALRDFGGSWTYERLDAYLKNSQEYIPGTAMVQRFPRDTQRADLLAYLATLTNGDPVAFPEPAPAPEPEETADAESDSDVELDTAEQALDNEPVE